MDGSTKKNYVSYGDGDGDGLIISTTKVVEITNGRAWWDKQHEDILTDISLADQLGGEYGQDLADSNISSLGPRPASGEKIYLDMEYGVRVQPKPEKVMELDTRPLTEQEANRWTALSMKSVLTPAETAEYASLDRRNESAIEQEDRYWRQELAGPGKTQQPEEVYDRAAADRYEALRQTIDAAKGVEKEMDQWKEAHPLRHMLHRIGIKAKPLVELERRDQAADKAAAAMLTDVEGGRAADARDREVARETGKAREREAALRQQRQEARIQRREQLQKAPEKSKGLVGPGLGL